MTKIHDLDTPSLIVDLDILERNLGRMALLAKSGGKALRPHVKTHKTLEIARMQIQNGATGLTVAKLSEAETMANAGFNDLFIANQIIGATKVERLLSLIQRCKTRVGIDSREGAEPIGAAAKAIGLKVSVLIEVDTGLGRAGVRSVSEALELAQFSEDHPGLSLEGIFTHEGHLYKSEGRSDAASKAAAYLREIASAFAKHGLPCEVVSVGSTPGAAFNAQEAGLTEMRPGTYVFNDRTQVFAGVVSRSDCALSVLATVISVRPDGRVLIDAGTKTLAGDILKADGTCGELLEYPEYSFVAFNEEHGYLQSSGAMSPRVGEKVRVVPNHVCTCVNLHDTLTAFRGERVEEVWKIACRGMVK